jgi:hypothetical protein
MTNIRISVELWQSKYWFWPPAQNHVVSEVYWASLKKPGYVHFVVLSSVKDVCVYKLLYTIIYYCFSSSDIRIEEESATTYNCM